MNLMNLFESASPEEPIVLTKLWNLCDWLIRQHQLTGDSAAILCLVAALLCVAVPYLLGSINPAILISKIFYRDDVRLHGSGNAGTTNMLRTYGKKAAVGTVLFDFGKAIVATLIGRLLWGEIGQAIAGFFVGFGHMFPIYYRFRGGKGVACFAMVALVISPLTFLGIFFTFVIVLVGTRYVSLASVMAALMFPMFMNAFASDLALAVAMAILAAVFVVGLHVPNLRRLWANEEPKLDLSKLAFRRKKAVGAENEGIDTDNGTDNGDGPRAE
jgi:glycerol-3-phosphate acyltransferase PlsY